MDPEIYPIYSLAPNPFGEETPISICTHYGEHSQITGVYTGNSYAFGGLNNYTEDLIFITVRRDSVNGTVLGAGFSPLIVTAVSDADLFVHWNTDAACGSTQPQFYCLNTSMICLSCPATIDCQGVLNGDAVSGTPCDDNNPMTVRDRWNGNCECVGEDPISGHLCESAINIDCNAEPVTYSTLDQVEYYDAGCFSGINGLWFTFTGNGGNLNVSIDGSFSTYVAIYSGDCYNLELLDCIPFYQFNNSYEIPNSIPGESYFVYVSSGNVNWISSGNVTISLSCETTFHGSVAGNHSCDNRSASLRFYEHGTDNLISEIPTSIIQNGTFEIVSPPIGTYDIILDADACLNIGISNYSVSEGENNLDFGNLKPGDLNNDNSINISDISYLSLSYGRAVGDAFFDPKADSNCDGIVNISDVSILILHFFESGDIVPLVVE